MADKNNAPQVQDLTNEQYSELADLAGEHAVKLIKACKTNDERREMARLIRDAKVNYLKLESKLGGTQGTFKGEGFRVYFSIGSGAKRGKKKTRDVESMANSANLITI